MKQQCPKCGSEVTVFAVDSKPGNIHPLDRTVCEFAVGDEEVTSMVVVAGVKSESGKMAKMPITVLFLKPSAAKVLQNEIMNYDGRRRPYGNSEN
jgi:hypothetical protein